MERTVQGGLGHPENDSGSSWELGRVVDADLEGDDLYRFLTSYFLSCDRARSRWLLWRSHPPRQFKQGDHAPTDRAERIAGGCLWAGGTHETVGKWLIDRLLRGFKEAGLGPDGERPTEGQLVDVEEDTVGIGALIDRLWPHMNGHNDPDADSAIAGEGEPKIDEED